MRSGRSWRKWATWRERALNAEDALKAAHAEIRTQRTASAKSSA
ncbi:MULTISPECIES: hypothetical protein [unclassified Streptomyces]